MACSSERDSVPSDQPVAPVFFFFGDLRGLVMTSWQREFTLVPISFSHCKRATALDSLPHQIYSTTDMLPRRHD